MILCQGDGITSSIDLCAQCLLQFPFPKWPDVTFITWFAFMITWFFLQAPGPPNQVPDVTYAQVKKKWSPSLTALVGFSSRHLPSSVFCILGPRHLQKAQQWCLASQTHPPPYSWWVRTHATTREHRYNTSRLAFLHISQFWFRLLHDPN